MPQSALSWLLLLLAMALGALLASSSSRQGSRRSTASGFPPGYVQGVQDLFSHQPDQAVACFMRMLELEPKTVEPHFAIANVFRRRGEVDRAIRIHQNLIGRSSLDDDVRCRALEALADDYLVAGLLDRAESVARNLLESHPDSRQGLEVLLHVYELEKEWEQAIAVARSKPARAIVSRDVLAQYYCELAEQLQAQGDVSAARRTLREAFSCRPRFPRAELILGDIERAAGNTRQAMRAYQRLIKHAPHLLSEAMVPLLACYDRIGSGAKELDALRATVLDQQAITPVLLLAEALRHQSGDDAAAELVRDFIERTPSLRGIVYLLGLEMSHSFTETADGATIKSALERLASATKTYRCSRCGFSARQIHWQCPSCRRWDSIHAVQEHMSR